MQVTGSIDLGNAQISGLVAANVGLGDTFTIITAGSVVGRFAGQLDDGATEADATSATIAYIDNVKFVVNYLPTSVILSRQLANATMSLAPTIAAPVYGQRELFVATIQPESSNIAASGTVLFTVFDPDGNNFQFPVAIDPLTNRATFDPSVATPNGFGIAAAASGPTTISASYDGVDADGTTAFNPTGAGPIQTTVTEAGTTTALNSSANPSGFGANVTFTATVSSVVSAPVAGTLAPAGTVTFRDLSTNTTLGTITLVAGAGASSTAAISISSLIVGSHSIRAIYNSDGGADDNYLASQSPLLTQVVTKSATTTVVDGAPNPSNYGQSVTFTATIDGPGTGSPTGSVTFMLGSTTLGTAALNASGIATFTTTPFQLAGGQDQIITAVYNGDGNFNGSSNTTSQDVNAAASATSITTSGSPSGFGVPVTFTATVTSTLAGDPRTPAGVVTFILDGTTVLGVGSLNSSGIATFTTTGTQVPIGSHTVTAEYGGNPTYQLSTGSLTQVVNAATTTTNVTAAPATGVALRAITFVAHVGPAGSSSSTPTGMVEFRDLTTNNLLGTAVARRQRQCVDHAAPGQSGRQPPGPGPVPGRRQQWPELRHGGRQGPRQRHPAHRRRAADVGQPVDRGDACDLHRDCPRHRPAAAGRAGRHGAVRAIRPRATSWATRSSWSWAAASPAPPSPPATCPSATTRSSPATAATRPSGS